MNFWKRMNYKWDKDSISTWSSLRKTLYILFPLLVYFLVHDMAEILLWAGLNLFMERTGETVAGFFRQNAFSVRGIIYGIAICLGVAAIGQGVLGEIAQGSPLPQGAKEQKRESRQLFQTETMPQVTGYFFLSALAFLTSLGLNFLFSVTGFTGSSQAFEQTAQAQFGVDFWLGIILYGLLSPIAEEAVFRGLIYNRMKRCFRYEIALVVSSLLFGCYHGNLVQAVYGTILGLLMAYMYELYGSFAAPVLFHAVANVSIYVMVTYHSFEGMDKRVGMAVSAVSLAGAVGCFFYIRKCVKGKIRRTPVHD